MSLNIWHLFLALKDSEESDGSPLFVFWQTSVAQYAIESHCQDPTEIARLHAATRCTAVQRRGEAAHRLRGRWNAGRYRQRHGWDLRPWRCLGFSHSNAIIIVTLEVMPLGRKTAVLGPATVHLCLDNGSRISGNYIATLLSLAQ